MIKDDKIKAETKPQSQECSGRNSQ